MSDNGGPSTQEIADLVARLRALSDAGASADAAERAAFLADKAALLARIAATNHDAGHQLTADNHASAGREPDSHRELPELAAPTPEYADNAEYDYDAGYAAPTPEYADNAEYDYDAGYEAAYPTDVDIDDVGPEGLSWEREAVAASWAIAARDAAIDHQDWVAAARFTTQARDAIREVLATGATVDELAAELDYPGGAAELDGEHIDDLIERHIGAGGERTGWPARARSADPAAPVITVDRWEKHRDAEIAALADPLDRSEPDPARQLQDRDRVGAHDVQGVTFDVTHVAAADPAEPADSYVAVSRGHETGDPGTDPTEAVEPAFGWEMPGWMRERATRAEARWAAAGGLPTPDPARRDDAGVLAERIAALRAQIATGADVGIDAATLDAEALRREQLTRWHHDDTSTDHNTTDRRAIADDDAPGSGWSR